MGALAHGDSGTEGGKGGGEEDCCGEEHAAACKQVEDGGERVDSSVAVSRGDAAVEEGAAAEMLGEHAEGDDA